jgi:hypothetical protein
MLILAEHKSKLSELENEIQIIGRSENSKDVSKRRDIDFNFHSDALNNLSNSRTRGTGLSNSN